MHQETFHENSVCLRNLPSTFINIPYIRGTFCQLSIQLQDLSPTFINFPFIRGNFRQLSVRLWEIPSNSLNLLCVEDHGKSSSSAESLMVFSINFLRCCWTFRELPSTCCASAGHFVYFLCIHRTLHQLSVHLRNLPSTFCASADFLSNFVSFLCVRGLFKKVLYGCWIFCQHQSTFRAVAGLSVSFLCVCGNSVNFRQLSIRPRDYPLTFCVSVGHSVNFSELPCGRGTFRQLPVRQWDFLSTSVNNPCGHGTLVSCELSVHPQDLQ